MPATPATALMPATPTTPTSQHRPEASYSANVSSTRSLLIPPRGHGSPLGAAALALQTLHHLSLLPLPQADGGVPADPFSEMEGKV